MTFRKDLQMLRGIAVALVVLFHLGTPGFQSGFLGVDVFFVISGYLMAQLYDPAHKLEFFVRRARRILPAYFVLVLLTVIAAALLTVPSDYSQVSKQSMFAGVFASNIGFWAENSYFDKASFKPLLHLWSLGVELQFYILVPVIAWLCRRFRVALPLLWLGSALACFAVVGVSPKTAFFWLPFRLWEFLLGFGIAVRAGGAPISEGMRWLGFASLVAVVVLAFAPVDGEALGFVHGHPGLLALLITCATGVTLYLGIPRRVESGLFASGLAKLGDYSYAVYLAHFPIIVLLLYRPFSGTVLKSSGLVQTAVIVALIAAASALLHTLVERPGRKLNTRWLAYGGALCMALAVTIGKGGELVQKHTVPRNQMLIYDAWSDRAVYRCGKLQRILHPLALSCELTSPLLHPAHRVLLIGNSHADAIKTAFSLAAAANNDSVFFMVDNNPMMSGSAVTPERVMAEAKTRQADVLVLHYSPHSISADTVKHLAILANKSRLRLDLIMPVPVWPVHVPMALIQHMRNGVPLPAQTFNDYQVSNRQWSSELSSVELLTVYPIAEVFCSVDCRLTTSDGRPLYFDADHLTLTGAAQLSGVFSRMLSDL